MANNSDTLTIGSIRLRNEFPIAQTQAVRSPERVLHPEAAAIARARIAATPEIHPLTRAEAVPATPTVDLVTSKQALATTAQTAPMIHRRKVPSALVPFLTAAGIFLLVLLLFKAPIIINQVQYSLGHHPEPSPVSAVTPAAAEAIPAENTITIAKINVHAPVQYEPSIQEAAVQAALQNGVVHYGNTAAPGQAGNVAIFGHSSNDWWEPGNFKFVFVLLDKLSPGDHISLDYQSKRYTYEVTGSKVVDPTDVSVLNATPTPTLTLITCTPPGTSLRRLVVTAKQIDPSPNQAVVVRAPQTTTNPTSLTSSTAPSILDQITKAIDGVFTGITSLFGAKNPGPTPTPAAAGQLPAAK